MRTLLMSVALSMKYVAMALSESEAQFTVHVTDDCGANVTGIVVGATTFLRHISGEGFGTDKNRSLKMATDTNGLVTFSMPCISGEISFGTKYGSPGYYWDRGHKIRFKEEAGRWQPWNPTVELKVKRIVNPIPLYAKKVKIKIPVFNEDFGFDVVKGDWTKPYGNGRKADFIFHITMNYKEKDKNGFQDFDAVMTLRFSNTLDGIQSVYADPRKGSVLLLPRYAPEVGYQTNLVRRASRNGVSGTFNDRREDQNYFFRIRSVTNEEGRVVSALYGKMHGEIGWFGGDGCFTYYLSPTPNDRNLEFDGKNNLFKPDWRDSSWPREP